MCSAFSTSGRRLRFLFYCYRGIFRILTAIFCRILCKTTCWGSLFGGNFLLVPGDLQSQSSGLLVTPCCVSK